MTLLFALRNFSKQTKGLDTEIIKTDFVCVLILHNHIKESRKTAVWGLPTLWVHIPSSLTNPLGSTAEVM